MDIRFSERLEAILGYARDEAMRTGSYAICVDHLTLAILRDGKNEACRILSELGIDAPELKDYIDSLIFSSRAVPFSDSSKVGISRGVESTINLAAHEALRKGSTTVGPEHLLTAICRAGASASKTYLSELGVTAEAISGRISSKAGAEEPKAAAEPERPASEPATIAKIIFKPGAPGKIFS